jgi:hypothetical protein
MGAVLESGQVSVFYGGVGYFSVQRFVTLGMLDALKESPVMMDEEAVELLNSFAEYIDTEIAQPAVAEIKSAIGGLNPHKPKRPFEMLGEYLREAAVLILIFVPVDLLIPKGNGQVKSISPKGLIATLVLSLAMLGFGMWAEQRK